MTPGSSLFFRCVSRLLASSSGPGALGLVLLVLLAPDCVAADLFLTREGAGNRVLAEWRFESDSSPGSALGGDSVEWEWRWARSQKWTDWYRVKRDVTELGAEEALRFALPEAPDGARAVEVRVRREFESGIRRSVQVLGLGDSSTPPPRFTDSTAPRAPGKAPSSVTGRLAFRDRAFDLSGYTGAFRSLPLRRVRVELRRSTDDSLLAAGSTNELGQFSLGADLSTAIDVRVACFAAVEGVPGLQLSVRAGPGATSAQRLDAAEVLALSPGSSFDIGTVDLIDDGATARVQSFHLLDLIYSAAQMLESPGFLGQWPGAGALPIIVWDPDQAYSPTRFESGSLWVSSPLSGDSDGWSDAVVLAAFGQWVLSVHGVASTFVPPDFFDVETDSRLAFERGSAWTFAACVRAWRGLRSRDVDNALAEDHVSVLVDLPTPPPLGFSATAQGGFDLERRIDATGDSIAVRGQLGVWNVAAMGWDLADGTATRDGDSLDDDGLDEGEGAWFVRATEGLTLAGVTQPRFEDVVESWKATFGASGELDALVNLDGGCALYIDAAEDDDLPADARSLDPWRQPALVSSPEVVLNEFFLGDRDGVELLNRSDEPVEVSGWTVSAARNGFSSVAARTTTISTPTWIAPGRTLLLWEGSGPDQAGETFDGNWAVPWRADEDGACTLTDDGGAVVDFARWAGGGGADPSLEPVPAGTSYSGLLVAPAFEGRTLGRAADGVDLDLATDFQIRSRTPRMPNVTLLARRTLSPLTDLDHFSASLDSAELVVAQAWGVADDARPRWDRIDGQGEVLESAAGLLPPSRAATLETRLDPIDGSTLRLAQESSATTSAALDVAFWVPADPRGVQPVSELMARPRREGVFQDTIDVSWSVSTPSGGFEVWVDGALDQTVDPAARSVTLSLGLGSHRIGVRPVFAGQVGPERETGCWVGVTPCETTTGFDFSAPFLLFGMGYGDFRLSGSASLHDAMAEGNYPDSNRATAQLLFPVDLTADSRLSFSHAAHIVPDGDRAILEMSLDDGFEWFELDSWDGDEYPGVFAGTPNWLDSKLDPTDWVEEFYDLGAWAGQRALIRFVRESNASGNNVGWYIDELSFGTDIGHDWWISPGGSDSHGCGAAGRPFATLGHALEFVAAGDTLRFTAGDYSEAIEVSRGGSLLEAALPLPPGVHARGAGADSTRFWIADGGRGIVPLEGGVDLRSVAGFSLGGGELGLDLGTESLHARDLRIDDCQTGAVVVGGRLVSEDTVIRAVDLGVLVVAGSARLTQSTIDGSRIGVFVLDGADSLSSQNSLFTNCTETLIDVLGPSPALSLQCSGFFGSSPLYRGVEPQDLVDAQYDDPLYCALGQGNLGLAADSPYLDAAGCGRIGALGQACDEIIVDVTPLAGAARLEAPYPNPFNPRTRIRFALPRGQRVQLTLYDVRGRRVRTLVDDWFEAGEHERVWEGRDDRGEAVASGVYHLVMRTADHTSRRRAVLLR